MVMYEDRASCNYQLITREKKHPSSWNNGLAQSLLLGSTATAFGRDDIMVDGLISKPSSLGNGPVRAGRTHWFCLDNGRFAR